MGSASAVLEKLSLLGITITASGDRLLLKPGSKVPLDLVDEIRSYKSELITITRAYALADKINDILRVTSPLMREYNRLSWAVQDLQDAREPEEAWLHLREEEYRLGKLLEIKE